MEDKNCLSLKDIYYKLDDLEEKMCDFDLMIQGYIYAVNQDTNNSDMDERLRAISFSISDAISELKNKINYKAG